MSPPLDLQSLVAVAAVSALFTLASGIVYRRDPARRRWLIAGLALVLVAAPWWTAAGLWTLPVGLSGDGPSPLGAPVPWILLGGWWAVGGALVLRTAVRVHRGRRAIDRLPPQTGSDWPALTRELAPALGLSRQPALRLGAEPCASTLGGPVLILPPANRLAGPTRRAVLCHELAHLKRRDDRLTLLMRLTADWYWWLPWLRRLQRRHLDAVEESCDDLASRHAGGREAYVAGLMDAARRLRGGSVPPAAPAPYPDPDEALAWNGLLGQSHLAARVHRLLHRPRPTLDQSDGRWLLLWATLASLVVLFARPAAVPASLPPAATVVPLNPPGSAAAGAGGTLPASRVDVVNELRIGGGDWLPLPQTARDVLPVYPAAALAAGVQGDVTLTVDARSHRGRLRAAGSPTLSSTDSSGVLAAAVERALARRGVPDLGAGLGAVVHHDNDIAPPPGSPLRLRKTYRFRQVGAAPESTSITGGSPR